MARLSIHERGLAFGRLQAGQSVSQVRPLFAIFYTYDYILLFVTSLNQPISIKFNMDTWICFFFKSTPIFKSIVFLDITKLKSCCVRSGWKCIIDLKFTTYLYMTACGSNSSASTVEAISITGPCGNAPLRNHGTTSDIVLIWFF